MQWGRPRPPSRGYWFPLMWINIYPVSQRGAGRTWKNTSSSIKPGAEESLSPSGRTCRDGKRGTVSLPRFPEHPIPYGCGRRRHHVREIAGAGGRICRQTGVRVPSTGPGGTGKSGCRGGMPTCVAPLVTVTYRSLVIDKCAPCQGVWLDCDEFLFFGEALERVLAKDHWL